ncbi:MAG: cysteine rich repeat-containing protein [Smithella sp.]
MKKMNLCLMTVCLIFLFVSTAVAQSDPMRSVKEGCSQDIKTYCQKVTPGEARILACLYAYGDKLSGRCEYALYDASVQLERKINAVNYVANECRNDLQNYCSDIKPGEGRLLNCLDKNKSKVSARCKQAVKDVGLK